MAHTIAYRCALGPACSGEQLVLNPEIVLYPFCHVAMQEGGG